MPEYDPMEELGFIHDKQLICSCLGFLQTNNSTRDICERFIKNGGKFYDLVSRYEDVSSYVLNRKDNRSGNVMKALAPFLKASGATDYSVLDCCKNSLRLMPRAKEVMNYMTDTLPTFISTSSYEHNIMALCEALDIPISICDYSSLSLDEYDMNRSEGRSIREFTKTICSLKMPKYEYQLNTPVTLDNDETRLIKVMDEIFEEKIKELECQSMMTEMKSVGSNEKAYALLDIRKRTMIDFEGTAYIGGDMIDYQAMDLIRDGSGLSMAFNGSEFAVHGSNIAVISRDCTVAAVLVEEFYNRGIEAVYDLVSNWDRESLKKRECPDRALMDAMLSSNPRKLPEVHIVDKSNVTDVALKSDAYRKKLLKSAY